MSRNGTTAKAIDNQSAELPVSGTDLIRGLALLTIVVVQSFQVTPDFLRFVNSPMWPLRPMAWAVLFVIAGRTLADSASRHDARSFLIRRIVRAWVPVVALVLGMALIVGPVVSGLPARQYFSDPSFWPFLANTIGVPQFDLPGVFDFNTQSRTTVAMLWSVPVYAALVLIAAARRDGAGWRRFVPAAAALVAIGLAVLAGQLGLRLLPDGGFSRAEAIGMPLTALLAGLAGLAIRPRRLRRSWRRGLLVVLLAVLWGIGWFGERDWTGLPQVSLLFAAIGLLAPSLRGSRKSDWDRRIRPWMSVIYASWLISFPIQQIVAVYGPDGYGAWRNFALALPLALICGVGFARLVAEGLSRSPWAAIVGSPHLPIGPISLPRYSRHWWIAQLRALLRLGLLALAIALLAAGILMVTLVAFQPDQIGV